MQSEGGDGLHVAIIMDGNGRWAARRSLPRVAGHRAGVAAVRRTIEAAPDLGITAVTMYAFSSDNWRRPPDEVQSIFWLLRAYLRLETERLRNRGVRIQVIGRRDRLPHGIRREIERAERATSHGQLLRMRLAIDYSSREAIALAALKASSALIDDCVPTANLLRPLLARTLTHECGEVDLLIRTGGEKRLSDFLLWESAYAELHFTDRMWPDFEASDLERALQDFKRRERRFGGLPAAPTHPPLAQMGGAQ